MIKGVLVTTDGKIEVKEYENPLYKTVGKDVGGYIEIVRPQGLPRGMVFICNENGLNEGLKQNMIGSCLYGPYSPIVGDIVFMAEGMTPEGQDLIGLTDEQLDRLLKLLNCFK